MKEINYYLRSVWNEILKLQNTFAFWLSVMCAIFTPVIYFIFYVTSYKQLIPDDGINPWDKYFDEQIEIAGSLLFPLFIILIISLIIQIENKSSTMKYLFSLPIPKWSVYFGKMTAVVGLILLVYLIFFVMMFEFGMLLGLIHKELNFLEYTPNYINPIKFLSRSFMALLGVVAIQYWLSFRIKNFIIPLGIGVVLIITGIIIYRTKEAFYFPYAYNRISLLSADKNTDAMTWFPRVSLYGIIYFFLFSIFGYLNIKKMAIK